MKSNLFFIIGIRRSGTSILGELISKHPQVMGCAFEPHDLWAAVDLSHFPRLMKDFNTNEFVMKKISDFNIRGREAAKKGMWFGAKFALNPGVKALEWVWLKKTFPEARFLFIVRDSESTWQSYRKQDKDSVRGIISKQAYMAGCQDIKMTYRGFTVRYEHLLKTPNTIMGVLFDCLDLPTPNIDFQQFIKQPEF